VHQDARRSNLKKWLWRAANLAMLALVIWFVHRSLIDAWKQVDEHPWQLDFRWLGVAGVFYVSALFACGVFWYRALRALEQDARFLETMRAYYIGHLGKYVPGKAMVVVLRATLLRSHRVDTGIAAATVFLETLTWMTVGSFLAAAYLAVHLRQQHFYLLGAIGLMLVAGLPTCPPVFIRLARRAGVGRSNPVTLGKLRQLKYRTMAAGWALMIVGWTLMGLTFWATLRAMAVPMNNPLGDLPLCTAATALATVVGFIMVFIPAGLGVREAALAVLMTPYLMQVTPDPELVAWVGAALFRLVTVVSDVAISGIVYVACLPKWSAPKA
jgi:uncharacterized membrane protein YbhN (UPF0104 family)